MLALGFAAVLLFSFPQLSLVKALEGDAAGHDGVSAPDIIVVMIDDHAYIPDERVLQRLPAIRRLWLEGGLRFREMYDETPICCPARATVLTGQHTLRHGVEANDGNDLDPRVTIATVLHDAGYHTMLVGKYLTSYEGTRVPVGWDRVFMRKDKAAPSFWVDGAAISFAGQHVDELVRRQALEWLREAPLEQPVFGHITPTAPHREICRGQGRSEQVRDCDYFPLVIEEDRGAPACQGIPNFKPPDYLVLPSGKGPPWAMPDWPDGWPLQRVCESLLVVDRMVEELLDAQAQRGRPAWFVFLSDNGMSWGRKSFPQKHVPTATRLPFYVAGPGVEPGDSDVLLSNIDLAPTLAAMAGAEVPIADGRSFLPVLRGEAFTGRDEVLEIVPSNPGRAYAGWVAMRTPQWRYIRWDSGEQELYDLVTDPAEMVNLAAAMPDRAAAMEARLDEVLAAGAR